MFNLKKLRNLAAILLCLPLVACGSSNLQNVSSVAETMQETILVTGQNPEVSAGATEAVVSEKENIYQAYYQVLEEPAQYFSDRQLEKYGYFWYSLVYMDSQSDVPVLLLRYNANGKDPSLNIVKAVCYHEGVIQALFERFEGILPTGSDSARFHQGKDRKSLFFVNRSQIRHDGMTTKYQLAKDDLVIADEKSFSAGEEIPFHSEMDEPLRWYSLYDRQPLAEAFKISAERLEADNMASIEALGEQIEIFEGRLKLLKEDDLLAYQNHFHPNPAYAEPENIYVMFVFDQEQDFVAHAFSAGPQARQSKDICLGRARPVAEEVDFYLSAWELEKYHDQKLKVAIDISGSYWPSDTSLPLGSARAKLVKIIR